MTLHTYKPLHQRCISIEVIIGENQYSLWCQPKKNKFFTRTTLDGKITLYAPPPLTAKNSTFRVHIVIRFLYKPQKKFRVLP
jgi:hypothetical protein